MMETYLALGFPVGALLLAVCWRYLDRRIERLEHQRTQELKAANVLGVLKYCYESGGPTQCVSSPWEFFQEGLSSLSG